MMTPAQVAAAGQVLAEVMEERIRQHAKWGEQNLPDGTSQQTFSRSVTAAQQRYSDATDDHNLTYQLILDEEVLEAFAEEDPYKLRAELIQVAAVAVAWIEAIDRRQP